MRSSSLPLLVALACIHGSAAYFSNVLPGSLHNSGMMGRLNAPKRDRPGFSLGPVMQLSAKKPGKGGKPKAEKKPSSSGQKAGGSAPQQTSKVLDLDKREYIYQACFRSLSLLCSCNSKFCSSQPLLHFMRLRSPFCLGSCAPLPASCR
jgi:hypothetical protein